MVIFLTRVAVKDLMPRQENYMSESIKKSILHRNAFEFIVSDNLKKIKKDAY